MDKKNMPLNLLGQVFTCTILKYCVSFTKCCTKFKSEISDKQLSLI